MQGPQSLGIQLNGHTLQSFPHPSLTEKSIIFSLLPQESLKSQIPNWAGGSGTEALLLKGKELANLMAELLPLAFFPCNLEIQ